MYPKVRKRMNASMKECREKSVFMQRLIVGICLSIVGISIAGESVATEEVATEEARLARVDRIIGISEAVIPDPRLLQTPEWRRFTCRIRSPEWLALPSGEFIAAFNEAAEELPFSHFALRGGSSSERNSRDLPAVAVSSARNRTAVLTVNRFEGDVDVMRDALARIESGHFDHLVIDLRHTPGGAYPSAIVLGQYLTRDPIHGGVYLGRAWFERRGRYPSQEEISEIEPFRTMDVSAFRHRLRQSGVVRLLFPGHDGAVFNGKVYVLTSRRTASASEGFVSSVKERDGVVTIGERTAGSMMSSTDIPIDEKWTLVVPVADMLDSDGNRIDQRGIAPSIQVLADEALERALECIEESDEESS